MRILWVSRHYPVPKQINELKRLFGEETVIVMDRKPFKNAEDIARRMYLKGCKEVVIVAPIHIMRDLTMENISPIRAEMECVLDDDADYDVLANGRRYNFKQFVRIKDVMIKIQKEEVVPA